MMGGIWFACCAPSESGRLIAEVRGRDARARVLRVGDVATVRELAGAFPGEPANAALVARGGDIDELEGAIGCLARTGRAGEILVLADELDAASAARLFYAGASEVITAVGAVCEIHEEKAREGRGPECETTRGPAADDDPPMRGEVPTPPKSPEAPPPPSMEGRRAERPVAGAGPQTAVRPSEGGAPVVAVVSGRGGAGKTLIASSLATLAASWGMRAALIDLDLMFGDAYELFGIDEPADLGALADAEPTTLERAIEGSAMKIAPGLTLWGPLAEPERAELMGRPVEGLLAALRGVADIVVVDTSTYWGDAVASAVAGCDRCLVVGGRGDDSGGSAERVVELAARAGVAKTRMTAVYNGLGSARHGEDDAMRFEMRVPLRSRARVADGGEEAATVSTHAQLLGLLEGPGRFAGSVRSLAETLFRELGCSFEAPEGRDGKDGGAERPRIRLPWGRTEAAAS